MGMCVCPWRALVTFLLVKSLLDSMEKVNLLWGPKDSNESAHEATKWVENVVKVGNGFLTNVPPNIDVSIMNDTFKTLNE